MLSVPFFVFVLTMTWTPGPTNLSHMASGQLFGLGRTMPFIIGCVAGLGAMNLLVAFGLGGVFMTSPVVALVMKYVGMAYILYLGWRILHMTLAQREASRPFTFLEGILSQPASPKSWAMSVVGFAQFASPQAPIIRQALEFALTFIVLQLTAHMVWCLAGSGLVRLLRNRTAQTVANLLVTAGMIGATGWALFL